MKTGFLQRGISLVEALVALVVMSVGMLGIASLYVTSLQTGRSALLRTQAVNFVNDMADRIRANSLGRAAYRSADIKTGDAVPDCGNDKTCTPTQLAKSDLSNWMKSFQSPAMPSNAAGTVEVTEGVGGKPDEYRIKLTWREAGQAEKDSYSYSVNLQLFPVKQ